MDRFTDSTERNSFQPCPCCTCLCHTIDPHSWTPRAVLTESKQQSISHRHKNHSVLGKTRYSQWYHTEDGVCWQKTREREDKERTLSNIFLIPSFNASFFWLSWVWLCEVMINRATHGKKTTVTMEGVVLVGKVANRPACASQAFPVGFLVIQRWVFAKKNGYLIIILRGTIQKLPAMCKLIKLASSLHHSR